MSTNEPGPMIVEPYKSRIDGMWRVRVIGSNGEKVVTSESYSTAGGAMRSARRLVAAGRQGFVLRTQSKRDLRALAQYLVDTKQ